ncbi:TIGR03943 family protein [Schinkia azotoformans]|uniref:TIGR03943 family putative permease subunit n=1 Tax=Schinkia azotoformans TaxID=1454 RepID=UPI002E1C5A43|nr:TIGR03943 family protein [Schinkia azotoformans]
MKFRAGHFFRAVLLAAFGLLFIKLHITDEIYKYINPKYEIFSQITAAIFILFFFIQLFRVWERPNEQHSKCGEDCCSHDHDHGHSASLPKKLIYYSIIMFPLVTGFSIGPAVLDSSIAEKKGVRLQGVAAGSSNSNQEVAQDFSLEDEIIELNKKLLEQDQAPLPNNNYLTQEKYDDEMASLESQDTIHMDETIFEPYYEKISMNPNAYKGKKIKLSGFIYSEEGFTPNQLVISRYLITHCVADASIIGFLAEFEQEFEDIQPDTWIEVEGILSIGSYNGMELPIIRAKSWKIVEQPEEPYIYPVLTKIVE